MIWELWPAQDFGFRGDKYIMKKVRVVPCMRHPFWSLSMPLPNIKIFQIIKKLWSAREFGLKIHSGEIPRKRTEQDRYGSNGLHKISASGGKYIRKKVRVVSYASKLWSAQGCVYGQTYAMLIVISPEPIGRG